MYYLGFEKKNFRDFIKFIRKFDCSVSSEMVENLNVCILLNCNVF